MVIFQLSLLVYQESRIHAINHTPTTCTVRTFSPGYYQLTRVIGVGAQKDRPVLTPFHIFALLGKDSKSSIGHSAARY